MIRVIFAGFGGYDIFLEGGVFLYSVIIPIYNEENRVLDTAQRVSDFFAARALPFELIFVNDGSTDGSAAKIAALRLQNVRDVGYSKNRGKGFAIRTGAAAAIGDVLILMDADLAYGLEIIDDAIAALLEADFVIGSRPKAKEAYAKYPLLRKVASSVFLHLVRLIVGVPFSDTQCGFKCWKSAAAARVFPLCELDGFAFDIEALALAALLGLRGAEIPAVIKTHGDSKVNLVLDSFKMLRDAFAVRRKIKGMGSGASAK